MYTHKMVCGFKLRPEKEIKALVRQTLHQQSAVDTAAKPKLLDRVRDTKTERDRFTMLPRAAAEPLKEHLQEVRKKHDSAMQQG